jgi:hypothetical protein
MDEGIDFDFDFLVKNIGREKASELLELIRNFVDNVGGQMAGGFVEVEDEQEPSTVA